MKTPDINYDNLPEEVQQMIGEDEDFYIETFIDTSASTDPVIEEFFGINPMTSEARKKWAETQLKKTQKEIDSLRKIYEKEGSDPDKLKKAMKKNRKYYKSNIFEIKNLEE